MLSACALEWSAYSECIVLRSLAVKSTSDPDNPRGHTRKPAHLTGNPSILSLFLGCHLWISGCWESKLPETFGRRGPLPGRASFLKGHNDVSKEPVVRSHAGDLRRRDAHASGEREAEKEKDRAALRA